ncbi:YybH family protein [Glycomyces sambucus]|nr:nuclear transport factor 2 family protein [Glycomyces sambucus]
MTEHESDEAAIRDLLAGVVEAIRAKDLGALARRYEEDVVSFDVEPPLQHVGVAAKLENWERVFAAFAEVDYELRGLRVTADGSVAFAHGFGRLSGTLRNGAATPGMWVRATFGLKRTGGVWLIAHDQVSVPFDLPTGKGVGDLEP